VTVKLHVPQILRKINARNRSEAASIATRAGLL
jgi:DNA-binding NarL/FixJ family response regulator